MRPLFPLLPLVALALGTPAPYTERQLLINKIWGVDSEFGLSRADMILKDEAFRSGISKEQYLEECKVDAERMAFTDEEKTVINKDGHAAKKTIKIDSKDDVLKELEKQFPKSYAIFAKRLALIKEYMTKMDAESQKFLSETGDTFLEMLFKLSKTTDAETKIEQFSVVAKDVKKIVDTFNALPQSSQSALERAFCMRATVRIIDGGGQFKEFVSAMLELAETGTISE